MYLLFLGFSDCCNFFVFKSQKKFLVSRIIYSSRSLQIRGDFGDLTTSRYHPRVVLASVLAPFRVWLWAFQILKGISGRFFNNKNQEISKTQKLGTEPKRRQKPSKSVENFGENIFSGSQCHEKTFRTHGDASRCIQLKIYILSF